MINSIIIDLDVSLLHYLKSNRLLSLSQASWLNQFRFDQMILDVFGFIMMVCEMKWLRIEPEAASVIIRLREVVVIIIGYWTGENNKLTRLDSFLIYFLINQSHLSLLLLLLLPTQLSMASSQLTCRLTLQAKI